MVAKLVRALLARQNKTEAADAVGVSRQQLYRFERGEAIPTLPELERLAILADTEIDITLNRKGPPLREKVDRLSAAVTFLADLVQRLHPENTELKEAVDRVRYQADGDDEVPPSPTALE